VGILVVTVRSGLYTPIELGAVAHWLWLGLTFKCGIWLRWATLQFRGRGLGEAYSLREGMQSEMVNWW
jgi:hypothetical protein